MHTHIDGFPNLSPDFAAAFVSQRVYQAAYKPNTAIRKRKSLSWDIRQGQKGSKEKKYGIT